MESGGSGEAGGGGEETGEESRPCSENIPPKCRQPASLSNTFSPNLKRDWNAEKHQKEFPFIHFDRAGNHCVTCCELLLAPHWVKGGGENY